MKTILLICTLLLTPSCARGLSTEGVPSSICGLDQALIEQGTRMRVRAIFSPTSMHGDYLRDQACPEVRIQTYGYEQARGGLSGEFKRELDSKALEISNVEYEIDVSGVIERDGDGLWFRALSVHSYSGLASN